MFASIVVGTDGSATAGEAVRRAAGLAEAHSADLHVVSAYRSSVAPLVAAGRDPASVRPGPGDAEAQAAVERMLDEVRRRVAASGVEATTHVLGYDAATAILDVAEAVHADLIVVGNRGLQGAKLVLGSVPDVMAHRASCDVLIVNTV
jgi:nucleotide-binding universal stress UspA family protein